MIAKKIKIKEKELEESEQHRQAQIEEVGRIINKEIMKTFVWKLV